MIANSDDDFEVSDEITARLQESLAKLQLH